MLNLKVSSNLCSTVVRVSLASSCSELAKKLYAVTGVPEKDMKLVFELPMGAKKTYLKEFAELDKKIGEEFPDGVVEVSVTDVNENSIVNMLAHEFENENACENRDNDGVGFQLSEEDYASRGDTVLGWKKREKLGAFNPELHEKLHAERQKQKSAAGGLKLNERCSVRTGGVGGEGGVSQLERRGWLRYIGPIEEGLVDDIWCGVEFDEPLGKNNGTFKGKTYFGPVKPLYGAFVKPTNVETGPQFTPLLDDELSLSDGDEL
ncbi:Alf1p Ecym_6382 [Eremothecium cymbalariae DBVPG|uniref:CAP-Gly domain-containing protein n=1 Tax=Eremothecium cymbalariae (strain CBS 270.75 / DBVPG 7215 / KCTC 17166 / NRRL Y-17582) TaxID=931890 RepID=G8JUH7_ERECY|nr:hypothetical protein Ecym_6382 [Eremothecium cymbalariae DBVPG\